ncbi:MAG: VWA domain-containing protein [Bryobacteraceae bacterium]|jgi:VWFA-related protein
MKAFWTLPLIISIAYAQVELRVVATDHAGHPVTDLQPSDLRVVDDGSPQSITSLRLESKTAPVVAVLLDLMDLSFQQRNAAANQLKEALADAEGSLHLYLLVSNGGLYPVQGTAPQLDRALQKVSGVRPLDITANPVERFKTIYSALDSMSQELVRFPGPKQLLWITYGIPSNMKMVEGWVDLKPRLLQLAALFDRGGISVYTLDPGLVLGTLNRDGLEVLSTATGGRTFSSSDLKMALKQMGTDTSTTYLLDYSPSQAKKAEGSLHTVRLSSTRKGVRVLSQQIYLADAIKEPPKVSAPVSATKVLPPEPAYTFVGRVHSMNGQSMILELDDLRFVVIDFDRNAKASLSTGDRATVRSNRYDGHGMLAKSWSLLQHPVETSAAPTEPVNAPAAADPLLLKARETAALMLHALPDFLCKEMVARSGNGLEDTLSADVSYSGKTGEDYHEIRLNGQPTQKSWAELGGDVSTGEFGSMLRSLLRNPDSDFKFIKDDQLNGVAAEEYGFHVSRAQSDWKILSDYQFIVPEYSGRIWFDRSSNRVVRIERTAEVIPSAFPLRSVEGNVNFGEVRLGASDTYLLPLQAETSVCVRDREDCSRKTIEFSNYQKFTAESKIRLDQ